MDNENTENKTVESKVIKPRYKGVPIEIGGKEYIMPPLSPIAYREHDALAKIEKIESTMLKTGILDGESYGALMELVVLALQRNYPDMTMEFLDENLEDAFSLIFYKNDLIVQSERNKKIMAENAKNGLKQMAMKTQK